MDMLTAMKRLPRVLAAGLSPVFGGLVRTPNSSGSPIPESDERTIRAEVNKRKQRAKALGIITSAWELNHDFRYYEAWAVNCPELVHPAIGVTTKTETTDSNETVKRIQATIRGNAYGFVFRERDTTMLDGEQYKWGYLDVEFRGHRVMTVDCDYDFNEYAGGIWTPRDVSAFIEGPWVQELNSVFADVCGVREQRNRMQEEQARNEELRRLKKDFGL